MKKRLITYDMETAPIKIGTRAIRTTVTQEMIMDLKSVKSFQEVIEEYMKTPNYYDDLIELIYETNLL